MDKLHAGFARLLGCEEIVAGVRYRVRDAALLAHDGQYDMAAVECATPARVAIFLFRGVNGHYFTLRLTDWQDERDALEPVTLEGAMGRYRRLPVKVLTWEEAFPTVPVQDA